MNILEVLLFLIAVVGVISLGIWKSRDEELHGKKARPIISSPSSMFLLAA